MDSNLKAAKTWHDMGIDQNAMRNTEGLVFAVRRVEADYIQPAVFDDMLDVETWATSSTPARMVMQQEVKRGDTVLFRAVVTIVCIAASGKPCRLPAKLRSIPV